MFNKLKDYFYNCLPSILKRKGPYESRLLSQNFDLLSKSVQEQNKLGRLDTLPQEFIDLVTWWEEERPLNYQSLNNLKARRDLEELNPDLTELIKRKEQELEQMEYIQLSKLVSLYPYFPD